MFLKLHGGVNWWYEDGELYYLPFGKQPDLNKRWDEYKRGTSRGHPVLLEPSFYKYNDSIYDLLRPQWVRLVQELLHADLVLIIGYSLPEADPESRRALTMAFQGNPRSRWRVVDEADWVCQRYKRLFGTSRLTCYQRPYHTLGTELSTIVTDSDTDEAAGKRETGVISESQHLAG